MFHYPHTRGCAAFGLSLAVIFTATQDGHAGTLSLLTSPSQFAHDAFIDWTDLGPPSTNIPTPAFFIDIKDTALAARVSEAPTANIDGFQRLQANLADPRIGFISYPVTFATGDQLLFTGNTGINVGNMGFDFSQPVFGFGVELHHPGFEIAFNTRIEAFDNSGNSLGFFDVQAPGSSSTFNRFVPSPPQFFGIRSTVREIASILITPPANAGGLVVSTPLIETGLTLGMPTGNSASTAIVPTETQPRPEDGAWVFDNVAGNGRWFDPPLANGYTYQVTDGVSKIISIELPIGTGDADNQFMVEDPMNGSFLLAGGVRHTFPIPVDSFTVTGIDPAVDGGDPLAFPTFIEFDQLTVSFTQTPIPEPASIAVFGITALLFTRRTKPR